MKKLKNSSKYELYSEFVQEPKRDVRQLTKFYKEARNGKTPLHIKEDFCGTFYFCKEWIKSHPQRTALGVDNDWEPLSEGYKKYYNPLSNQEKSRLKILQGDVCQKVKQNFDICFASNFSYNCLKSRDALKKYFTAAYKNLSDKGIFVLDHMGGPDSMHADVTKKSEVIRGTRWFYEWELKKYNPTKSEALYYIHLSRTRSRREFPKIFTYDWRMWTLAELNELLLEVGFKKVKFYWENSHDHLILNPHNSLSLSLWIVHLVAIK